MSTSMFYRVLRAYVSSCAKFYFKKVEVHGLENIPETGPVIFAANHQNAFLDAILIHLGQPRAPHFLTRGDVFEKKLPNAILRSLNMRPIYRFRDGIKNVKRNEATFSECYEILESGRALGIFPEGNHASKFYLRTLQRGCSRILFDTEQRNNFNLRIQVIPVGIQYYGSQNSRARVLIQFGKPVPSEDLLVHRDEREFQQGFTQRLAKAMKDLILNLPEESYDTELQKWLAKRHDLDSVKETFQNDLKLIEGHRPHFEKVDKKSRLKRMLLTPIAIYGGLNHLISYPLFVKLMDWLVSDKDFMGSIKFGASMVYFPAVYILQTWLLSTWLGPWTGLYFLSLPVSGLIFRDFIADRRTHIQPKH